MTDTNCISTLNKMKKYIYILLTFILTVSCEVENVAPLLDDLDIIFFMEDGIEAQENSSEDIVVEIGSTKGGNSAQLTVGGTAVAGVDYTLTGDLNLTFAEGVFTTSITISLIDNINPEDDHTLILSLPTGQGYSEDNRREFVLNIINNEVSSGTVVSSVSDGIDDAEEGVNGAVPGLMELDSSDLEFGENESGDNGVQKVGLRFHDITIPQGATIISASIQFTVDEDVDAPATVVMSIFGENVDNSSPFAVIDQNISDRPLTTASVDWDIPVWATVGEAGSNQKTSNIASVIQEIVSRPGWASDNTIGIIFVPTAATLTNPVESGRVAEAFDGDVTAVPVITIEWEL